MNLLLTGATGFIGSNLCEHFLQAGHRVYALCRESTSFERCQRFQEKVVWLRPTDAHDRQTLEAVSIDALIHTAWGGVASPDRDDWTVQLRNFDYSRQIIDLALSLGIPKIVCLGSQAEYGQFEQPVEETAVPEPVNAYGAVKLLTLHYLRERALHYPDLTWHWLRIFSLLGTNEQASWLLPQVMGKLLKDETVELTGGEQVYDYLAIPDFMDRMDSVLQAGPHTSGVYNLCSGRPVKIKDLLLGVATTMNVSPQLLHFGAIPYRKHQSMQLLGSPANFQRTFGPHSLEPLDQTLDSLVRHYTNQTHERR